MCMCAIDVRNQKLMAQEKIGDKNLVCALLVYIFSIQKVLN